MKRLFWGIPVLDALKEEGSEQIKKVKSSAKKKGIEVKWSPPENFHITLLFMGETPEEIIDELVQKVRLACREQEPFEVVLRGGGAFPEARSGRVIYVGVKAKKGLMSLQESVFEAVSECFALEEREYRPHMTLGRLKNRKNLKDLVSPMERKNFGNGEVKEVVLFESVLGGPFPKYSPLATIPLGEEASKSDVQNHD